MLTTADGPFGRIGAARYDHEASCMPRRYKYAHAIQNDIVRKALGKRSSLPAVVIDLGCGTAADGIDILLKAGGALYLGLDYSKHMLARAIDKVSQYGIQSRALFLQCDLRVVTTDDICAALEPRHLERRISSVVSALTLHHYDLKMKARAYKLAYDLLSARGLLVLTDLYSNTIAGCAEAALRMEVRDVRRTVAHIHSSRGKFQGDTTLSEHHYKDENQPQVLIDEVALLAHSGFSNIDLVYRSGQLGVIVAERGEG